MISESLDHGYTLPYPPYPIRMLDGLIFSIGLISFYHLKFIGEVYPAELVLIFSGCLLLNSKYRLFKDHLVQVILISALIWFSSQVITDWIRQTPFKDLIRGWASIMVFTLDFISIYAIVSNQPKRLYMLLFGFAMGWLMKPLIQPSPYFAVEPWKFGFGPPITILLMGWIGWKYKGNIGKAKRWSPFLLMLGGFSIYMNARSLGGFTILTAFLIWFRASLWGRWVAARRLTIGRILLLALTMMITIGGVKAVYSYTAAHGWLGAKALKKYQMQSPGKLGILLGGRLEVIPAIFAVMDSPIIGHGSWAKGPKYRDYLILLLDLGYRMPEQQLKAAIEHSDLIPAHSHILQNWVWGGILAAIFWVIVLIIAIRSIWATFQRPHILFVPLMFIGLTCMWNIAFSPYGSMMRFSWAMNLTLLILSLRLAQVNKYKYSHHESLYCNHILQSGQVS